MAAERDINVRVKLKGADTFKKDMSGVTGSIQGMNNWLDVTKGILTADAIKKGFEIMTQAFKACVDESIAFESAMAGVAKTTDFSDFGLAELGDDIKELSTKIPMAATEIAGLVEAGGQLGIPKENLLDFAEVMANFATATSMSAEEAATSFAKLANIMGTDSDDYERMGSVVVELGNNMATTEQDILNMATRMASTAEVVGLSETEVFALAGTMSSLGIEADAGGTAMSKLMKKIETAVATGSGDLTSFAEVAGVSAEDFATTWSENPIEALALFLGGLGEIEEKGGNAITTLEEMDITEVRLSNAVLAMSGSSELLVDSLAMADEAWKTNTALAEEAATRYETTQSKIALFENSVSNLQTAIGDKLSPMINNAIGLGTNVANWLTGLIEGETTLTEMIAAVDAEFDGTAENIKLTGEQAQALIDRLAELEGKPELTAAEQNEWNASLERLISLVPQTASLIDLQTGSIEGGTEALRENTQATIENAIEAAKQAAMAEKYELYNKAISDHAERMVDLTIARKNATLADEEAARIQEELAKKMIEAQAAAEERTKNGELVLSGDILRYDDEYQNLENDLIEANQAAYEANLEVKSLEETIADSQEEIDAAADEVRAYGEALDEANEAIMRTEEAQKELEKANAEQIAQIDELSEKWTDLTAEYSAAYTEALSTINGIVDGFGKIEMPETVGLGMTLSNLDSQIKYLETYEENLEKVQEMGLDPEIVTQLSDGTAESAGVLAGIVADGGERVDELNEKFAAVSAAKDSLAEEMATVTTDFEARAAEIEAIADSLATSADKYTQSYSSGASTVQGMIDGLNSKLTQLRIAAARVSSASSVGSSTGGTSHAAGLSYVPFDGYPALLHRGEMVLTSLEARAYRAEQFANDGIMAAVSGRSDVNNIDNSRLTKSSTSNSYRFGDVYVREAQSARELVETISQRNRRRARGRGQN